jgi:hypothetical protein
MAAAASTLTFRGLGGWKMKPQREAPREAAKAASLGVESPQILISGGALEIFKGLLVRSGPLV